MKQGVHEFLQTAQALLAQLPPSAPNRSKSDLVQRINRLAYAANRTGIETVANEAIWHHTLRTDLGPYTDDSTLLTKAIKYFNAEQINTVWNQLDVLTKETPYAQQEAAVVIVARHLGYKELIPAQARDYIKNYIRASALPKA